MHVILLGVARYHSYPNRQVADYKVVFVESNMDNVILWGDKHAGLGGSFNTLYKCAVFDSLVTESFI
jgi:hypothetical protein